MVNPLMRWLLRSPVAGLMGKQLMLLRFAGRKSGRRYAIPVAAHRVDGELYALTGAGWQHNFHGGVGVEVTLAGRTTRMRGQLLEDPEAIARVYARRIDELGVRNAQWMIGLKIHTPGTPPAEALAEAARRYPLAAIQFAPRT
jgi:hypothetical protein